MKILNLLPWFAIIFFENTFATDTLKPKQTLLDRGRSLVSVGGQFEFGFFSLGRSENRYLGIRYRSGAPKLRVVWIANRENPIKDASGVLTITESGNILLFQKESSSPIWFSNSSMTDPILQLLSTGNLVVKSSSSENYAWKSIDHPQDTQITGMKLGTNLKTGHVWRYSSWASLEDPAPGEFTIELEPRLPQLIQRQRGSEILYRSPPWNGAQFGRDPARQTNFRMVLVHDETEVYYTFETMDATVMRFWVSPDGSITLFRWAEGSRNYADSFSYSMVSDECDSFARCGPNGICQVDRSTATYGCGCLAGFVPRAPQDWAVRDWSGGCVSEWDRPGSSFVKVSGLKLPYSSEFSANKKVSNVTECELICRGNRSCVAFTVAAFGGCVVWFGELLDIRVFNDSRGQDLYLRLADPEVIGKGGNQIMKAVIISVSFLSGFLVILCAYITRKRTICLFVCPVKKIKISRETPILLEDDVEPHAFGFDSISIATNNFCQTNIIGQGGFGPVYKGTLPSGQQIAVKRLSHDSGQGLEEFKNEVLLIAKLQHRNLVRLLGRCIHREEMMLIYEYMPNKSLDLHIFKQTKDTSLNWQRRYDIIVGIARGLLYLHRDSRLRIIHRDLKAGNILLDSEMNPKISDFGSAKVFGGEMSDSNTKRIFGTYGYMSPEYAIDGNFSVKSDVFSFGVTVLEMVSGKRNRGFEHPDHDLNLLGHAWILWSEGRAMEFIDDLMEKNDQIAGAEILRCIQMGLLCVQKRPEERPLMSYVDTMLHSNCSLPQPEEPGFFIERVPEKNDPNSSLIKSYSYAQTSITELCGR